MKKTCFICAFILLTAQSAWAWQIADFKATIQVLNDSSLLVTETITADFNDGAKHGIKRFIPVEYTDEYGRRLPTSFKFLSVKDENGQGLKYEESSSGAYRVLKIGDPYRTLTGKQTYVISYQAKGVILFHENYDELYWNVTGNEWDAPIRSVEADINLPGQVPASALRVNSFRGRYGSKDDSSRAETGTGWVEVKSEYYQAYEGLTVAVGWPKGFVTKPSGFDRFLWFLEAHWPAIVIPVLTFFVMFMLWFNFGKDPKLNKSVVTAYEPPEGLRPAEVGMLVDDKIDIRDLSATLIDLAVKGYIKIEQEDKIFAKDYSLVKVKDFTSKEDLHDFERYLFDEIFHGVKVGNKVPLSKLENSFYKNLDELKKKIFAGLKKRGYYSSEPQSVKKSYYAFSVGMVIVPGFFASALGGEVFIACLVSAVIIFAFAQIMPAKTRKGTDALGQVLGFEEFLSRTEKDKIRVEEQQNVFERMLPYAICFGFASKWAKIFPDIYPPQSQPMWFSGRYDHFTTDRFVHDINHSVASMGTALSSVPRSVSSGGGFGGGGFSGGGFSGGGFGGGGGSSW